MKGEEKLRRLFCKSLEASFKPGPRVAMDSALQMSIDKDDLLTWTKAKKLEEIFSFTGFRSIKGDHSIGCQTF